MTADDVIKQMAWQYGNCQTYQDAGLVSGFLGTMQFETYFVKPDLFRFGWFEIAGSARYCIWSNGRKVFANHYLTKGVEERSDLSHAIDGADEMSHGAAATVSCLLLPDLEYAQKYGKLLRLPSPALSETPLKSGERCHKISALETNRRDDLWVRESDFSLLQYISQFTTTPETDAELMARLQESGDEFAEEMRQHMLKRPAKVRQQVKSSMYHKVIFDQPIDEAVFDGPGD